MDMRKETRPTDFAHRRLQLQPPFNRLITIPKMLVVVAHGFG